MTGLLDRFGAVRDSGRKLLVPYIMAGIPERSAYADVLAAVAGRGDAIEIGLPYSDPLMDGPVISSAGERAIRQGIGPLDALDLTGSIGSGRGGDGTGDVPRLAMTYYNPIHRTGERAFCERAAGAGFAGLIVPDLPIEESSGLRAAAAGAGLAWVPLVAPTSSPQRVAAAVASATGFVYAVSTLGVTGTRESLADSAGAVVAACRAATDLPVLIGVGVSTPEQARAAVDIADGVVIGSAVVRLVLERGAAAAVELLDSVRAALDA